MPQWPTCEHDGGWQYLGPGKVRCRKCNIVRFNPDGLSPVAKGHEIREVVVDEYAARIAQLEAALRPFAEAWVRCAREADSSRVSFALMLGESGFDVELDPDVGMAAAQALGMLDPDPEGPRAEVGLG